MAKIVEKYGITSFVWQNHMITDGMNSEIWQILKKVMAKFFKIF